MTHLFFAALTSAAALLAQGPASAPAPATAAPATAAGRSVDDCLPGDALFALRVRDLSDVRDFLLGKGPMFEDPAFRSVLASMEITPDKLSSEFETEMGFPLKELLDVCAGPAGLAVVAPDAASLDEGEPEVLLAVATKPGPEAREVWKKLQKGMRASKTENVLRERDEEIEGAEVWTRTVAPRGVAEPDAEAEPRERFFSLHNDMFLAAMDRASMQRAILAVKGKDVPSLAGREEFRSALSHLGPAASWVLHFSFERLWTLLDENEETRMAGPVIRMLGLRSMRGATLGIGAGRDAFESRMYVHAPGARTGILKVLSMNTKPLELGRFASSDDMGGAATFLDPSAFLAEAERIMGSLGGATQPLELKVGDVDLRKDFLELLQPPMYTVSSRLAEPGAEPRDVALMYMPCRDAAKAEAALKAALTAEKDEMAGTVTTSEYLGRKIHTIEIPAELGPMGAMGLVPCFAAADGFFFASLTGPEPIRAAFRSIGKEVKPLSGTAEYKRAMAGLPAPTLSVSYTKLGPALESGAAALKLQGPMLQMMGVMGGDVPFEGFADLMRAVAGKVEGLGYSCGWDEAGLTVAGRITQPLKKEKEKETPK